MNWRRSVIVLFFVFIVSAGSSLVTWFFMSRQRETGPSWEKILSLTPKQKSKFSAYEAELNIALKDIDVHDAQNRILLCSYVCEGLDKPEVKSAIRKMVWVYQAKQEKIASSLVSISSMLTPEQRKVFSQTLMREACESCRKSTGIQQCLCGSCDMHN